MATELKQIFKCELCGNMVESVHAGGGELVCCGQPMKRFVENTVDAAREKHVPVLQKVAGGYSVKVGDVAHPMEEKHYIEWIELIADDTQIYRKHLKPGEKAEANFKIDATEITVRAYCNLHGLWKA